MSNRILSKIYWITLIIILLCSDRVFLEKAKVTKNVQITADDEKLRDAAGYEAIKELHRLMDDDQSGSIDRFESNDFLQEDMKLTGSDKARRERAFHHDDESITVDDMWESWFESEERSWDERLVADWLINIVKFPQYEKHFLENKVTGIALPRMAVQNSSYLINTLGIKNFVHRQKLQLKALDLVLFGYQEPHNSRFKDIILAILTILCIVLGVFLTKFHKKNKNQVEELTKKLTELKSMETEFEGDHKKFNGDEDETESLLALKSKLEEAEKRLEMTEYESIPYAVQPLLRRTYQSEINHINEKKVECLQEMREAKEFVDRMRKRQGNFLNSLKLATGATALGTDMVDAKVFALKQRMEQLKTSMDECQQRWMQIEDLCGFSITGPYATNSHISRASSSQAFYTPPSTIPAISKRHLEAPTVLNGSMSTNLSSSRLNGRKTSQPPHIHPTFFVPNNTSPVMSQSETPPLTISSQNSAAIKTEVSTVKSKGHHIGEDTNSLASSKSSSSIGQKLNNIFKRKMKT